MELVPLLVTLIVLGLVAWLVWFIVERSPLPQPFKWAVEALCAVILIVILLRFVPGLHLS